MQHKATNFELIYFLKEINFLKVTSPKTIIILIFLFFMFLKSMRLLIVYLQRTYFLYSLLKKKKRKKKKSCFFYLTYKQRVSRALCLCWQCIFLTNAAVNSSKLALFAVCFINLEFSLVVLSGNIDIYEHAHFLTF